MKEVNHTSGRKNDSGKPDNVNDGGKFYQCPVGGFASLRPGVCPKCGATLAPDAAATSERMKEASR